MNDRLRAGAQRYQARIDADLASGKEPSPKKPKSAGLVTRADIKNYPAYYISGPGRAAAEASGCRHGYRLTDSCPMCD